MSNKFWEHFKGKDFQAAQQEFEKLDPSDKQEIFQELFQKSEYHRMPMMVSILRRELHDGKSFSDFYQSWLPSADKCNPLKFGGQSFRQHFPVPVRVINAINHSNPQEVISIGITWVANADEERAMWQQVENISSGKDENNELRREKIKEAAEGELIGLFRVETDDNLGTPF